MNQENKIANEIGLKHKTLQANKFLPKDNHQDAAVQKKTPNISPSSTTKSGAKNISSPKATSINRDKKISNHVSTPVPIDNNLLTHPPKKEYQPLQLEHKLDNCDFTNVKKIQYLGGNAEGAFLVCDGTRKVVMKIANDIDSAVMAYNLAIDFNVTTPLGRYLPLDSDLGVILKKKVNGLDRDLSKKINSASCIILWSFVEGLTIEKYKEKNKFSVETTNFEQFGRILVFDAAILNADRFKIEFDQPINPGNIMIENGNPVAIDQAFASIDRFSDATPGNQIETYGSKIIEKMKPLFSKPINLANKFCDKMIREGYFMFEGQVDRVSEGISQGIDNLKNLLRKENSRLGELTKLCKKYKPTSDLSEDFIRNYWSELLNLDPVSPVPARSPVV